MDAVDEEVKAMSEVNSVLSRLSLEAAERVVRWAAARYGSGTIGDPITSLRIARGMGIQGAYGDFSSLFEATDPQTESKKALVAGFWFQTVRGQPDFDALQVNAELKNLGHGLSNVTRAFNALMAERPQLAIQIRKSGKSMQARKKYRLTAEGLRAVEAYLVEPPTESRGPEQFQTP